MNWQQLAQHLLCPPGNGVYTVNTAKERKAHLHQQLFADASDIESAWSDQLHQIQGGRPLLLGVSSDCGGGILRGANWGPLFIRLALREDYPHLSYDDLGDVRVIPHLLHDKYLNESTLQSCRQALYHDKKSSLPVSPLSITEEFLSKLYEQNIKARVFGLGGDHSVSYPLTKSYLRAKKKQGIKVGLLHFDAHTDLLVQRLGIDLCFGSWCTHILEDLPTPEALVQVGIRSSAQERNHWENTFNVRQYWANEIHQTGPLTVIQKIIDHYKNLQIDELYISFDIDALDEQYASATGTPETGGLTPEQSALMLTEIAQAFPITGGDMVEVAPFVQTAPARLEPETTLKSASSLSALILESMGRF